MDARVVTMQIKSSKVSEAVRIFRESVIPAAEKQQGFKGGLLLMDRAAGKGLSITMWETEADMRATEAGGYLAEQIEKFAALLAAPLTREAFEVRYLFV
jgi:heme-degrading monooxygenase HmoA